MSGLSHLLLWLVLHSEDSVLVERPSSWTQVGGHKPFLIFRKLARSHDARKFEMEDGHQSRSCGLHLTPCADKS